MDAYTGAVCRDLSTYADRSLSADTIYFGGGTPNLLGADRLNRILQEVRKSFRISENAEITLECNPATTTGSFLQSAASSGINRLSIGMQSTDPDELRLLGRRHTQDDVKRCIENAGDAGIKNLSLDLMIGTPGQALQSLLRSIDFCERRKVQHVSAYLLKIEPGTEFARLQDRLDLPDDDTVSDRYLSAVTALQNAGFLQYEISNFAKPGFESVHNSKYWLGRPYLGFGPSAHSFFEGRRFYCPGNLESFLTGEAPVQDGPGGTPEEALMLRLRLRSGISDRDWTGLFGAPLPDALRQKALSLEPYGLVERTGSDGFALTPKGFLVSNEIIAELLALL